MALMLPHSIFVHIPKTGGMWVREAIRNAGIPAMETGSGTRTVQQHNQYWQLNRRGKSTFAFVRHPLSWYASFWNYRMLTGWQTLDRIDPFMSVSFERFVWNVTRFDPGQLSDRYERFTGPNPGMLDFVGRTENLVFDLVKALRWAGEEFDEAKLLQTPRQNVSLLRPVYSDRLREAVLRSEREGLERFGYLP